MTLGTLLQPGWLVGLVIWNFLVLSAVQLTVRLIMAFSVRLTALAAGVVTLLTLTIAFIDDLVLGPHASLATRLMWAPLPMLLMGLAGFATARWVLRFRRLRGQIVAGVMLGLLDPHLFTLLSS